MGCMHYNAFDTTARFGTPITILNTTFMSRASVVHMAALCTLTPTLKRHKRAKIIHSSPKYKTGPPVCLFGGKGNSSGEIMGFSWDSLKDTLRGLRKEKKVQDLLRDQMRKREFGGDDDDGNPPGGGGQGGGGGGGGFGNRGDGSFDILDETLQVIFATLAFICLYIYIIKGPSLILLARDYIKYRLGGAPSLRLQNVMNRWKKSFEELCWLEGEEDEDWLAKLMLVTPTLWYDPQRTAAFLKSKIDEYEQNKNKEQAYANSDQQNSVRP